MVKAIQEIYKKAKFIVEIEETNQTRVPAITLFVPTGNDSNVSLHGHGYAGQCSRDRGPYQIQNPECQF